MKLSQILEKGDAAGWALLCAGMLIIALTVLTPAYLDAQSLHNRRTLIQARYDRLDHQLHQRQALVDALQANDPLLLQRLAWNELRLKPIGSNILDDATGPQWGIRAQPPAPQPQLDAQEAAAQADLNARPNSRLVRLTSGQSALGLMTVGGLLILGGLLSNHYRSSPSPR